jgi:hypothetical protein
LFGFAGAAETRIGKAYYLPAPKGCHVAPPSVLLKTPAPLVSAYKNDRISYDARIVKKSKLIENARTADDPENVINVG